jgi:anti-sigma B factor antagonist
MWVRPSRRYNKKLMPPITLGLEKNASSNETTTVYHAKGKLSLETVSGFVQQLRPDVSPTLVLDMSGVNFLDSAGVGALVSLFVNRRNHGKVLALAALPPQAKAVVLVAGLHNMLPIYATVEDAANGKKS